MAFPEKLRFRARGDKLVTDYGAMEDGVRRFVGRTLNPHIGPEFQDKSSPGKPMRRHAVFEPNVEADEIAFNHSHLAHYAEECRAGSIWAADEETARLCGVTFDPTFGGELAAEQAQRAARLAASQPKPAAAPVPALQATPAPAAASLTPAPKGS